MNILLAFAFGMMAGGNGSGLLGSASSLSIMASLLGGQAAIQVAVGNDRRGSLIAAGATCGGVGALVVLSGCAMLGESFNNTFGTYRAGAVAAGGAVGVLRRHALRVGERIRCG